MNSALSSLVRTIDQQHTGKYSLSCSRTPWKRLRCYHILVSAEKFSSLNLCFTFVFSWSSLVFSSRLIVIQNSLTLLKQVPFESQAPNILLAAKKGMFIGS